MSITTRPRLSPAEIEDRAARIANDPLQAGVLGALREGSIRFFGLGHRIDMGQFLIGDNESSLQTLTITRAAISLPARSLLVKLYTLEEAGLAQHENLLNVRRSQNPGPQTKFDISPDGQLTLEAIDAIRP